MQLTTSPLLSAHLNERRPLGAPAAASASPPAPAPAPDAAPIQIGQAAIDRFTAAAASQLPVGNQAIVDLPGRDPIVVNGTRALQAPIWANNVQHFVTDGAQELVFAEEASPGLSIAAAGAIAKPLALLGVPDDVSGYVNKWYDPTIRAVEVASSVKTYVDNWKNSQHTVTGEQPLPTTPLDGLNKAVDVAHVVTSSVGLAGELAAAVNPSLSKFGAIGAAVAVTGDVADFVVNGMRYIQLRDKLSHGQVGELSAP